jgi:hypothetical protein
MTDTEIKQLFESNGQFATGKDYALIRAFEIIIRQQQQQRTWVWLTENEKADVLIGSDGRIMDYDDVVDAVEAKLKEKNA